MSTLDSGRTPPQKSTSGHSQQRAVNPVLSLKGVSCELNGFRALKDLNFELYPHERLALVGSNGSGKTTLLKLLHGLIEPQSGELTWHQPLKQAMLFQRPQMLNTSVTNHVALAFVAKGLGWGAARYAALELLAQVGLLGRAQHDAKTLSIGQQQRLSLARAWALEPEVLFLDEPTASLDPASKQQVEAMIEQWTHAARPNEPTTPLSPVQSINSRTWILSSHNLGQVKRLASRVIYLEQGCIHADLPVWEFFNTPLAQTHPKAHAFLQGELI